MKKELIIRAWKDEDFEAGLSETERRNLPENPAGVLDVDDDVLRSISGGCADCCGTLYSFCPYATTC